MADNETMTPFQKISEYVKRFHNNLVTEAELREYFESNYDICNSWESNGVDSTEFRFTWRVKRPDTIGAPADQFLGDLYIDNCWAIALSRGQSALVKLMGSRVPLLSAQDLLDGVHPRHLSITRGTGRLEDGVVPFMVSKGYVDGMKVHHRPRGYDHAEQEAFELLIERLLARPVVAVFEAVPSYITFSGEGIFCPTETEFQMRAYRRFPSHMVMLSGKGVEVKGSEIKEFWEGHDSGGSKWGDQGFIRLARHKHIITAVVEMTINMDKSDRPTTRSYNASWCLKSPWEDLISDGGNFTISSWSSGADSSKGVQPAARQTDLADVATVIVDSDNSESVKAEPVANTEESFADWVSSDSESELEDFYSSDKLYVTNLNRCTKSDDFKSFFTVEVVGAVLYKDKHREGRKIKTGYVQFNSLCDTKKALEQKGEQLHGCPVHLARLCNSRVVLQVSGLEYDRPEETIKQELTEKFEPWGKILKIFLPKNRDTGCCLSFGYVYMDQKDKNAEEEMKSTLMEDGKIRVEDCTAYLRFRAIRAEMEAEI